jgi:hypothetical protein
VHNIRRKIAWWLAKTVIGLAAAGVTAWSLYVVARYFGLPTWQAVTSGLVFDGIAVVCLHHASESVRAGRSGAVPLGAGIIMASISIYLNHFHAQLIHGGTPASLFFASPTFGMLAITYFSWSSARDAARVERGEAPMRLPSYGFLTWILASGEAGAAVKRRAVERVTGPAALEPEAPEPVAPLVRRRTAHELLVDKFSRLTAIEVVDILSRTHPALDDQGLADMARRYGHDITPQEIAMICATERITVRRATPAPARPAAVPAAPAPKQLGPVPIPPVPAAPPAPPAPHPAAPGQEPALADLVRQAEAQLGPGTTARDIAEAVTAQHGPFLASRDLVVNASYVRTVRSRDRRAAQQQSPEPPPAPIEDPLPGTGNYL